MGIQKSKFLAGLLMCATLILAAPLPANAADEDLDYLGPQTAGSNPSVSSLLQSLNQNPKAVFRTEGGWTIAELQEETQLELWSFAPTTHPAYPAAAQRRVFQKDGAWYVETHIVCEAAKTACDQLSKEYQQLDEQMRQALHGSRRN